MNAAATMTAPAARFALLGISDEVTVCECCGKADLKCTLALQENDADVVYYGRDCGSRALGWTVTADRAEKFARGTEGLRPRERSAAIRAAVNAGSAFGNKGHRDVARLTLECGIEIEVVSLSYKGPGMFDLTGWSRIGGSAGWFYWRRAAVLS